MDKNLKKVVISLKSNKLKTITMLSPNIDDSLNFQKNQVHHRDFSRQKNRIQYQT